MAAMKIGEVARRSGLTVRTLHYYDEIGLLSPSRRSPAGYRLYDTDDLERISQILVLRRLGLSLAEMNDALSQPDSSLRQVLGRQIDRLKEDIEDQTRFLERLEAIQRRLDGARRITFEDVTEIMETLAMFEKYYTPEQLEYLEDRRQALGEERIRQAEQEWPELIARMQEAMASGTDPASSEVQALARRWQELVEDFTGGDRGIEASLRNLYGQQPQLRQQVGLEPDLLQYVAKAGAAGLPEDRG